MIEILKSLLISFAAVAILLPVVRYALRKMSPAGKLQHLSTDEAKYLQKKEWHLTIAYYLFACILSVFCAGALAMLSSILHMSSKHMYVLTPNFRALFAPGLLFGLTLAMLPLRLSQRALLGSDYQLYKQYMQQQEGIRSTRTYSILFGVMLGLSLVAAWFAMRWHINIDENQVQIVNLLNQERTYPHHVIESIHYMGEEGAYLINFDDQTSFNTTYLKPVPLEMIALLAEQSGKRVVR
ncbi:hypothetical protein H9Q13_09550 [Pontibacter sp. JH31]|uniref:Uncharacterized protein n=1 Tax=Pontibacter aquaedesilientis TaxID=2766980 RepID=A0ABR7XGI4_9BACT|nr:hypothetical protein [Pontibacter aquaedesilientis]MBD1397409.1 hypothetical protein [Pontibacter aquaedesilientis]